jgi:hypothetical protein
MLPQQSQQKVAGADYVAVLVTGLVVSAIIFAELVANLVPQDALGAIGLDLGNLVADPKRLLSRLCG